MPRRYRRRITRRVSSRRRSYKTRFGTKRRLRRTIVSTVQRLQEPIILDQTFTFDVTATASWPAWTSQDTIWVAFPIDPIVAPRTSTNEKYFSRTINDPRGSQWCSTSPANLNFANTSINTPMAIVDGQVFKRTGFTMEWLFGRCCYANIGTGTYPPLTLSYGPQTVSTGSWLSGSTVTGYPLQIRLTLFRAVKGVALADVLTQIQAQMDKPWAMFPPHIMAIAYDKKFNLSGDKKFTLKFKGKKGSQTYKIKDPSNSSWTSFQSNTPLMAMVGFNYSGFSGLSYVNPGYFAPYFQCRMRNYYFDN